MKFLNISIHVHLIVHKYKYGIIIPRLIPIIIIPGWTTTLSKEKPFEKKGLDPVESNIITHLEANTAVK